MLDGPPPQGEGVDLRSWVYAYMLGVCVLGGEEGCFVCVFRQRWELVVDAGFIPALQSPRVIESLVFCPPPLHISLLVSVSANPP